jgi:hypothetical protein
MGDRTRGLYGKFFVERTDGKSAPGERHDGCEYYVLDLHHDKYAVAALRAYAEHCQDEYPLGRVVEADFSDNTLTLEMSGEADYLRQGKRVRPDPERGMGLAHGPWGCIRARP